MTGSTTRRRWSGLAAAGLLAAVLPARADPAAAARAALQAYVSWWNADARAEPADLFADDLELRHADGPEPLHRRVRGLAEVRRHVRAMGQRAGPWRLDDLQLFPTLHGDVHVAQFTASQRPALGDTAPRRTVVLRIESHGARVVRLVVFGNPVHAADDAAPAARAAG